MEQQPRALIVEDSATHRYLAETLLGAAGFTTWCAGSLLQGLETALTWLAPSQPRLPTLILLDLMLPHERCPILEGTALAAYLADAMEAGTLHAAHMVALTSEPTELRCAEAELAGVTQILCKPLSARAAAALYAEVDHPPILPSQRDEKLPPPAAEARRLARHVQRRDAARLLHFLRSDSAGHQSADPQSSMQWTSDTARMLLLEPMSLFAREPWQSWARAHGGIEVVQARLRFANLPDDSREVLDVVLTNGVRWRSSLSQLNISKTTYYRRLDALCEQLAVVLTLWA